MSREVLGIPWYSRASYDACRALMADADELPPTYDEWRKRSHRLLHRLRLGGHTVVKAWIKVESFGSWCAKHGIPADGEARRTYADDVAKSRSRRRRAPAGPSVQRSV
jgi:hypothetical protein